MTTQTAASRIIPTPKTTVPLHGDKRWAYLSRQKTIRLATTDEDGSIYLSPLWFVVDNKKLFLPIDAAGRHGRNGEAGRPLAALVDDGEEFSTVTGVRIVGRMVRIDDTAQRDRLNSLLSEKYFALGHPYKDVYFEMGVAAGRKFYELVPEKIVGWDAREISVPPGPESRVLPDFVKDRLLP
jgi:nitroimidazol reductase NimA-like FMN-containing flavoprotein (pyridoxamine 5'-phosphate oxidase superfamily)